jgi:glycosyltransferase involved in cell wall biosynthesis
MPRLKVFSVISSSSIGGAEIHFATLLKGLAGSDIELSVACHESGPMIEEYRAHAADVWPMNLGNPFDPRAALRLEAVIRRWEPDIVHTHLWNADVLGGWAARRARAPAAVSTVYGAYHLPIGQSGLRSVRRGALSLCYRTAYRGFVRVIALSNYIRDDLSERSGVRVDRGIIEVIRHGFDAGRVAGPVPAAAQERPDRSASARLINVANFFPTKGQEWLIRALPLLLERFPAARCAFVGDGPDRARMQSLAVQLGLREQAEFVGAVPNPSGLLAKSDIFVLPSLSEGMSLAILEAWACGLPVVASDVGGIPEAIEHRRTGILVRPRDPRALAEAIIGLLSDPEKARQLATAGREAIRTRFTSRAMAEGNAALYRRLAAGRWSP